jgi:hypothetical protein
MSGKIVDVGRVVSLLPGNEHDSHMQILVDVGSKRTCPVPDGRSLPNSRRTPDVECILGAKRGLDFPDGSQVVLEGLQDGPRLVPQENSGEMLAWAVGEHRRKSRNIHVSRRLGCKIESHRGLELDLVNRDDPTRGRSRRSRSS